MYLTILEERRLDNVGQSLADPTDIMSMINNDLIQFQGVGNTTKKDGITVNQNKAEGFSKLPGAKK